MSRGRAYVPTMHSVTVEQLRDELDQCLRLAAGGETVVITEHDRPLVRLTPAEEDPLDDLRRRGVLRPARRQPGSVTIPHHDHTMTLEQILRELDEDRADRDLSGQLGVPGRGVP